jgi:hypothetical protein
MKIVDNKLYVSAKSIANTGIITIDGIYKTRSKKNKSFQNAKKVPGLGLCFPYEDLSDKFKAAIISTVGDPYEYIKYTPIVDKVKFNLDVQNTLLTITKNGLHYLSHETIEKLATAASWLDMLQIYWVGKKAMVEFDMSLDDYIEKGYMSLIHGNTGKVSNAAKVKDERCEAYLLGLIEGNNQHDDVMVCYLYNIWAKQNGYKELESSETVASWRRRKEYEITIGRYGNGKLNDRFIRQVKGFAPTAPCMLWESDDNNLDFYFTDPDPKAANKNN